jgi:hypothetical protein
MEESAHIVETPNTLVKHASSWIGILNGGINYKLW